MTLKDEQILKIKISRGDREAFAAVFRGYWNKTFLFLKSLVKSEDDAKDLAQDVFFKLWKNRKQLASVVSLDSFIFTVARNTALDYFRKSSRKDSSLDEMMDNYLLGLYQGSIESQVSDKMELETIRDAIAELPRQRKDIFMLSRFMGVDNSKIAELLNISKKTVENQISLANNEIRKKRPN